MEYRTTEEVRSLFLSYFEKEGHRKMASHALIPPDDPTLLFVNAGMVQFKDIFTGQRTIDPPRATTSQKCLRVSGKHNDLENVGRTARHHTFFEMLGNFSFGDYFKEQAIRHAWEFLTDPQYMGLDKSKLWVTVHPDDEEAETLWREATDVNPERILKDPENFWSMGDTGPCGPCSEIHIDQGSALSGGEEVPFGEGGDRYLELWNLVFMQFNRNSDGELHPLPSPSIDTGMGLERIVAISQGKTANYGIDLFQPLFRRIERISGKTYGGVFSDPSERDPETEDDVAFRVIADHARATTFLIADGIYPENEGRGYVLRRVMRRAIRFGRKLGIEGPFFHHICDELVTEMGHAYAELERSRELIDRIVLQEEERFGRTLVDGCKLLETEINRITAEGGNQVSGDVVFTLCDTHGFPMDLTRLISEEHGVGIDEAGFNTLMEAQRERGRSSWKGGDNEDQEVFGVLSASGITTEFVGYDTLAVRSEVVALLVGGVSGDSAKTGDEVEVLVSQTPFYAESGGQVGDCGAISVDEGVQMKVVDTQRHGDLIVHEGKIEAGSLQVGDTVELRVVRDARAATQKNHSATHLVHWALMEVLGEHVKQRGSLVAPDRLRFDFSHFGPMTPEELMEVERLVNEQVVSNISVDGRELPYEEAVEEGAIAFFGEKYGDTVRVISMGESKELCGGTHVSATGEIGLFKIISEGGVSSGVRRIEAVTGMGGVQWVHGQEEATRSLAELLKVGPLQLDARVRKLARDLQTISRENEELKAKLASSMSEDQMESTREIGGVKVLAMPLEGVGGKDLRAMSDTVRDKIGSGVILLASKTEGKVSLLVAVTSDLTDRLNAGAIISEIAPLVGGRGGGREDLAQAGGSNPAGMDEAVERFYTFVEEHVT